MGLIIAFVIFIGTMIAMLITGHSMVWALLAGLVMVVSLTGYVCRSGACEAEEER